jgi:hypothetical protein
MCGRPQNEATNQTHQPYVALCLLIGPSQQNKDRFTHFPTIPGI